MQSYFGVEICPTTLFDIDYSVFSLDELLDKFIRMRDQAVFERNIKQKYSNGKRCPTLIERLASYKSEFGDRPTRSFRSINTELCTSDEENDNCIDNLAMLNPLEGRSIMDQRRDTETPSSVRVSLYRTAQWKKVWSCIRHRLDSLPPTQIQQLIDFQTLVLAAHITHRVSLDPLCFNLMIECAQPALISQIFTRQLIESRDIFHIDCLFDNKTLFEILMQPTLSHSSTKSPSYIMLSITNLIYKARCFKKKEKIIKSMYKNLRHYIMVGRFHPSFKTACKFFLEAMVTCGMLKRASLIDYLSGPYGDGDSLVSSDDEFEDDDDRDMEYDLAERVRRQPDIIDEEDDDDLSDMSDNSDIDMEAFGDRDHEVERIQERRQPADVNNGGPAPTVGSTLGLGLDDFKHTLASSLKNKCRLVIKSHLTEYTQLSVQKLIMLPDDLKEYLLYEPECNRVQSFANMINDMA